MNLPKFTALPGSDIEITAGNETCTMRVVTARQGRGGREHCVILEGLIEGRRHLNQDCRVTFAGEHHGGGFNFLEASRKQPEVCKVEFEVIISNPSFWA